MKNRSLRMSLWARALTLALFAASLVTVPARADVAPPEAPPGTNIVPGSEATQVRMVSEIVTLTVLSQPAEGSLGQAKTVASFLMRNLGQAAETLEVRFPLTFFNGQSDGFGNFPEINAIQVVVNGQPVTTRRIESSFSGGGDGSPPVPWAAFTVTFPPGQDVPIEVTYLADGFGYQPNVAFRYILETGAGWKDTIGTAEVIVRLPYPASSQNVVLGETTGFSETTSGVQMTGNEVRWHYENLEPTREHNITISLVAPAFWKRVLAERENTAKSPSDGEAWGRLGKACKEAIRYPKGYLRGDPGGLELYQEAVAAYAKSVELLPKDALWHYGFADLLWSHYLFDLYYPGRPDYAELARLSGELRATLTLDPQNEKALELAQWISAEMPWALSPTGQGFDYLILTATPTESPLAATEAPLPTTVLPSTTPAPAPTALILATATLMPAATAIPESPSVPVCGGTAWFLPLLAAVLWLTIKRK